MTLKSIVFTVMTITFLSGCATTQKSVMTPLEIQSMQSRHYEATKWIVFRSIISVFQDMGYTISNANIQTGLIYAESISKSDPSSRFWFDVTKVSQTKATAFVETIGDTTYARLNFVEINKTSSSNGQTDRQDTALLQAKFYEHAFDQIENAIFIRSAH